MRLGSGIYGHDFRVSRNINRIIHVADVELNNTGVIIYEIVNRFTSDDKSGNSFTPVNIFSGIIDRSAFDQLESPIRPHFSVDAELTMIFECRQHSIGYGADARFQRRTALDEEMNSTGAEPHITCVVP